MGPVNPVLSRKPEPVVSRKPKPALRSVAGPSKTRRPHNSSNEEDRDSSDEDEDAEDEDVVGPPPPPVDPQTPSPPMLWTTTPKPSPRGAGQPRRPAPEPPAGGRPGGVFPQKPPFMESLPSGCLLSEALVACGGTGLTRIPVIWDREVKTLYLAGGRTGPTQPNPKLLKNVNYEKGEINPQPWQYVRQWSYTGVFVRPKRCFIL